MTCPLCADHYPRVWGEHTSPDGRRVLGACEAPDDFGPAADDSRSRARLAEVIERIKTRAVAVSPATLVAAATHLQRTAESEDDDGC